MKNKKKLKKLKQKGASASAIKNKTYHPQRVEKLNVQQAIYEVKRRKFLWYFAYAVIVFCFLWLIILSVK